MYSISKKLSAAKAAVLGALMMVIILTTEGTVTAQTALPEVDVFIVHSEFSGASVRAVTPGPSNSFYVVAPGNTVIYQDSLTLSTAGYLQNFSALLLKPTDSAPLWARNLDGNISFWDTFPMPDGGIAVVGDFTGQGIFLTNGVAGYTNDSRGNTDVFVGRYRADGTLLWLQVLGGAATDHAAGVAVDEAGNITVAGRLGGTATVGTEVVASPGLFVAKYDVNGTFLWVRSVTGGSSQASGVSSDPLGNYYVGGSFSGSINAGGIALSASSTDVLVLKYDADGNILWGRQGGSALTDDGMAKVRASGTNGVVCQGTFVTSATFGTTELTSVAGCEGFVFYLDAAGNWGWAKTVGGDGDEIPIGMGVDLLGNIYLGGYFDGTLELGVTNLTTTNSSSWLDSFIIRMDPNGDVKWAVQLGGSSRQNINDLRVLGEDEGYFWGDCLNRVVYNNTNVFTSPSPSFSGFYGTFYSKAAPKIVVHPADSLGIEGQPLSLTVKVSTFLNLRYQWYKGATPILGATNAVFTLPALSESDEGGYSVLVSNNNGGVLSNPATVTLYDPPVFTFAPAIGGGESGGYATNIATVTGFPAPVVTWRKSGGPVLHTGDTFIVGPLTADDEGIYEVTASNLVSVVTTNFYVGVNLIPNNRFFAMVHDPHRDIVYLTSGTNLLRYSMITKGYLPPYQFGSDLRGVDVSLDGKYLVVADNAGTTASNWVHLVDLETEEVQKISFERGADEGFTQFVAFGSDGRAVVSSANRLRSLNITNQEDVVTLTTTSTYQLAPSASRELIALGAAEPANGTAAMYSVALTNVLAGTYSDGSTLTAVGVERREAQSVAVSEGKAVFLDSSRGVVQSIGDGASDGPIGAIYHPFDNHVYLPWIGTSEVRVYDTDTFTEVTRYTVGAASYDTGVPNRSGQGQIARSGDLLFVTGTFGVRYVTLPVELPVVLTQPKPVTLSPGFTARFQVKAYSAYPLTYRWEKNGDEIPDATGPEYEFVVPDEGAGDGGRYRVKVINSGGFVYSDEAQLTVLKHDPGVVWDTPAGFLYGGLLDASHLNATAVAPGTFAYSPPIGTRLDAGHQPLQVIFTPQDTEYYETITNIVHIDVAKRLLTYSVGSASRMFGLPNSAVPLNVTGFIPGESVDVLDVPPVVISPATETSPIGGYPMTYGGGSDNNYFFAYGVGTLTVTRRTVAITLSNLSQPFNGTPRSITATPVPAEAPLSIKYNGFTNAPTAIGSYPVQVATSDTNYLGSTSGVLTIFKGGAAITWNTPAPIVVGTALGSVQYNAVAAVNGIYTYSPLAGAVLPAGQHTLRLIFTPLDTGNYLRTTNTVVLNVLPLTLTQPRILPENLNEFRFDFAAVTGVQYLIEVSNDLVQWSTLTTVTAQSNSVPIIDPSILTEPRRFYRIRPSP